MSKTTATMIVLRLTLTALAALSSGQWWLLTPSAATWFVATDTEGTTEE